MHDAQQQGQGEGWGGGKGEGWWGIPSTQADAWAKVLIAAQRASQSCCSRLPNMCRGPGGSPDCRAAVNTERMCLLLLREC